MKKEGHHWCTQAQKGCTECKTILAERILEKIKPIREKREVLEKDRSKIEDILHEGAKKAKHLAQKTLAEVKEAVF